MVSETPYSLNAASLNWLLAQEGWAGTGSTFQGREGLGEEEPLVPGSSSKVNQWSHPLDDLLQLRYHCINWEEQLFMYLMWLLYLEEEDKKRSKEEEKNQQHVALLQT